MSDTAVGCDVLKYSMGLLLWGYSGRYVYGADMCMGLPTHTYSLTYPHNNVACL